MLKRPKYAREIGRYVIKFGIVGSVSPFPWPCLNSEPIEFLFTYLPQVPRIYMLMDAEEPPGGCL